MKDKYIEYFVSIMNDVAKLSTCYKRQVGAVIVSKDNRILSTGYNGTPAGMFECKELVEILKWIYDNFLPLLSNDIGQISNSFDKMFYELNKQISLVEALGFCDLSTYLDSNCRIFAKYSKEEIYNILIKIRNSLEDAGAIQLIRYKDEENLDNFIRDFNFIHYKYEIHAEQNAIAQAVKYGVKLEGSSIFIPIAPCLDCARLIVASGIRNVFCLEDYVDKNYNESSIDFLKNNNVEVNILGKIN